ncbi:MAG: PLP-dependent transferase [Clostridia bacterium]|nr:PLP-dependent transferase [Clostridia bacterium]
MAFLTEEDRRYTTPEDICAHVGDEYEKFMGAVVPPVFQNSLFVRPKAGGGMPDAGYAYTRMSNPTTDIAERKIAALEGGDGALCFSSGMGAISSAIMHFVRANCHVVLVDTAYGCTLGFIKDYLHQRFNVDYTLVSGESVDEIRAAIRPDTRLIYLESPSSLVFRMQDLDAVAALAREKGIGTVIDNSYATPLYQQPLKHGVDMVCHTASKYLGGHSDIVAGAVAARREIIESIQNYERAWLGSSMDPHQASLLIRGLRTLTVRVPQHAANAEKVAAFLENSPKIRRVFYPGSRTFEQNELFHRYMTRATGLLSFVPAGGWEDAVRFTSRLRCFQNGCSWGGFESLCIPLGQDEAGRAAGRPDNLVRMHVGLENVDTLIADISQALDTLPDA